MRICIAADNASARFGGESILPLHYFSLPLHYFSLLHQRATAFKRTSPGR
jgi:hypothetical protein